MLAYNPDVSRLAAAAITTLNDEERIHLGRHMLFSANEENLIRDQPADGITPPPIEVFEELLMDKAEYFFPTRTAGHLRAHWIRLQYNGLLSADNAAEPAGAAAGVSGHQNQPSFDELCEALPKVVR